MVALKVTVTLTNGSQFVFNRDEVKTCSKDEHGIAFNGEGDKAYFFPYNNILYMKVETEDV